LILFESLSIILVIIPDDFGMIDVPPINPDFLISAYPSPKPSHTYLSDIYAGWSSRYEPAIIWATEMYSCCGADVIPSDLANSKLPEALFYSYLATKDKKYLDIAKSSLDFLSSVTFENGVFAPIGQNGWYFKDGKKANFDQQPIEAGSMVQTLILAHKVTNKKVYLGQAIRAFQWFLGANSLNHFVYDESTGGCHDGLGRFSININQGAESTLAYLIASLSLHKSMTDPESSSMFF